MHHCLGTSAASQELIAKGVISMTMGVNNVRQLEILFLENRDNFLYVISVAGRINGCGLPGLVTSDYITEYCHLTHGDLFNDHNQSSS